VSKTALTKPPERRRVPSPHIVLSATSARYGDPPSSNKSKPLFPVPTFGLPGHPTRARTRSAEIRQPSVESRAVYTIPLTIAGSRATCRHLGGTSHTRASAPAWRAPSAGRFRVAGRCGMSRSCRYPGRPRQ
jgi:hypothetical protein